MKTPRWPPGPPRQPVPTPAVRPTRFVVSTGSAWQWHSSSQCAITVEERSPGWWAVCRHDGRFLNLAGGWEPEPVPTRRTELWLRWHRFDLHTAMRLAVNALPSLAQVEWLADGR